MWTLDVSPEVPQNFKLPPASDAVEGFPWYLGCTLTIDADGMIGSGVVCTGLTPPGGWSETSLDDGATDWPYHGSTKPNAHPYALIGSLDGGTTWFYVGRSALMFSDTVPPAGSPPPVASLLLAVNRPNLNATAAGDHAWSVTVTHAEPDAMHPLAVCGPAGTRVDELRNTEAPAACMTEQQAERNLADRVQQIIDTGYVAGGLAVALIGVAVAIAAADAARDAAAQQAASAALGSQISAYTAAGAPAGGTSVPAAWSIQITPAIAGEVVADAVLTGVTFVRLVAQAFTSPLMSVWWIALIIGVLAVALAAAVAVLLAFLLSLLTLSADVDNARSDFESIVSGVRNILDFMHTVGCPGIDDTVPTCTS